MISLENVSLRYGKNLLLDRVNWVIYSQQHIGIIGKNGSGKTSFFSLLLGENQADTGDITLPKQLKLAHVAQETPALSCSALDFVLDGDEELRAIEAKLEQAYIEDSGEKIAKLHEQLSIIDAYTAPARAAQLLAGLGFKQEEHAMRVSDFSGGWRIRLNLARALMCRSDMLLLDEPTNHLDLDAVLWLEEWLKRYPGTMMIISHDRDFLDKVVSHVAHLSQQQIKVYTGNYSTFERNRAAELELQQATYDKQQRRVAHLQSFVDRFRAKASKAKQAQSRLKAIERMDLVCKVQADSEFTFEFKEPSHCSNPMISLDRATISYGDHIVLSNLNLSIGPKERIAILGPNGAGKTSLIKLLAGELAASKGERVASSSLKIGYFAQHQVDRLHLQESPLYHFRQLSPKAQEQDLRKFLGSFAFAGDRVFEPIHHFSGGEKARLALALLVWQQPNLLLMDEPTNHLDLEMRHALSIALQAYEGSMILVSHDRFLVRSTTDKLMLVANGQLQDFDGDLDEYERWLLDYRKQQAKENETKSAPKVVKTDSIKPLLKKIEKVEQEMDRLTQELQSIEAALASSELYEATQQTELAKKITRQSKVKEMLAAKEEAWMALCAEKEGIESNI